MKKVVMVLGAVLVSAGVSAPAAFGQEAAAKETTITAQVVDMSCYLANGLKGPSHKMCTQVCAKRGIPLVFLGEDGQIYLPVDMAMPGNAFNKELFPHAEQSVQVTGRVIEKAGTKSIVVKKIA